MAWAGVSLLLLPLLEAVVVQGRSQGCAGSAICTSWSDNPRAPFMANGRCEFGHTSVTNYPSKCEAPCQGTTNYECTCVTKDEAEDGQAAHRQVMMIIGGCHMGGSILLCGFLAAIYWHCSQGNEGCQKPCCKFCMFIWPPVVCVAGLVLLIIGLTVDTEGYFSGCTIP